MLQKVLNTRPGLDKKLMQLKDLNVGELIFSNGFSLQDAMSAFEVGQGLV
jgi:hypothetical protein